MKRDFDFEEVGKKVPYQIPEGFFEEMQRNVLEQTKKRKSRKSIVLRLVPVISAAAAVLVAVLFIPFHQDGLNDKPLTQAVAVDDGWIEHISDEDLELMSDFSDYDIFMNQE